MSNYIELITSNQSVLPKAGFTPLQSHFNSFLMLSLAMLFLGASIFYGLSKGMDGVFPGPMDTRAQQIASAISDSAYGLDLQHAVHRQVLDVLRKGGMSDIPDNYQPLGLSSPSYMTDTGHWNNLLSKASQIEKLDPNPTMSGGKLTFIQTEDLGLVDFYKLSFRFFGYNIQGFFKTYFLLLCISVILVFAAFWSRPGILLSANLLLFGLFISICSIDLPSYGLSTVANGRYLNTLAIIPSLHLAILLWRPPPFSALVFTATALQSLMLGFVISARSSSTWAIIFLAASALFIVIAKTKSHWASQSAKNLFRMTFSWPMIAIFFGLTTFAVTYKSNIHPAYSALDELLPEHYFWHSLAYGLGFDKIEDVLPEIDGHRGDELGPFLGNAYMKKKMGFITPSVSAYYASNLFPDLGRPRSYERVVRAAFIDFALHNPLYMCHLIFVTKPRLAVRMYIDTYRHVAVRNRYLLLIISLALIYAVSTIRVTPLVQRDLYFGTAVIGGLTMSSFIPALAAYPALISSGDTIALLSTLFIAAITIAMLQNESAH